MEYSCQITQLEDSNRISQQGKYLSRNNIEDHKALQRMTDRYEESCQSENCLQERTIDKVIMNKQTLKGFDIAADRVDDMKGSSNGHQRSYYKNRTGDIQKYQNSRPSFQLNQIEGLLNQLVPIDNEILLGSEQSISRANGSRSRQSKITKKGQNDNNLDQTSTQNQTKSFFQDVRLIAKIRKRLLNFYQNYTYLGKVQYLKNKNVKQEIKDKSDIFVNEQSDFNNKWLALFDNIWNDKQKFKIPLLNPQSNISLTLQLFFSIFSSTFLLVFSLIIIFQAQIENERYLYRIALFVWNLEIIIKLNTSTFQNSIIIKNRMTILIQYIKNTAIYDVIPIVLLLYWPDHKIAKLFFQVPIFIKLVNIFTDFNEIQRFLLMSLKNYYYVKLVNLVIKLFSVAHIIACLWYLVAIIEVEIGLDEKSWIQVSPTADGTWWKIYIEAIYWSLTLMVTGSNIATTVFEIFFTSFIMLFTTIFFAYILNTIGLILSEIDQQEENYRKDVNTINNLMRRKDTSKNLQRRANIDLEYFYLNTMKNNQEEEEKVLGKISQEMNDLIKIEYNKNIISKIKCIYNIFSKEIIQELCLTLEEVCYFPNQIIFKEGETKDSSLMFIVSGQGKYNYKYSQNYLKIFQSCSRNILIYAQRTVVDTKEKYIQSWIKVFCQYSQFIQYICQSENNSSLKYTLFYFIIFSIQFMNYKKLSFLKIKEINKMKIYHIINLYLFCYFQSQEKLKFIQSKSFLQILHKSIFKTKSEQHRPKGNEHEYNKVLANLKKGQIFGELNFFTGMARRASVKSKQFTTVMKIDRDHFLQIIKDKEKDFQQFCQIKDNILLYDNYEELLIKCKVCESFEHLSNFCPQTHFDKSTCFYKVSYDQKIKQNRFPHKRKLYVKFQSRKDMFYLKSKAQELIQSIEQVEDSQSSQNGFSSQDSPSSIKTKKSSLSKFHEYENEENSKKDDVSKKQSQFDINEFSEKCKQSNQKIGTCFIRSETVMDQKEVNKYPSNLNYESLDSQLRIGQKQSFDLAAEKEDQKEFQIRMIGTLKSKKKIQKIMEPHSPSKYANEQKRLSLIKPPSKKSLNYPQTSSEYNIIIDKLKQQLFNFNNKVLVENQEEDKSFSKYDNPWEFESLKDYNFYFTEGNSKQQIQKLNLFQKKKTKSQYNQKQNRTK